MKPRGRVWLSHLLEGKGRMRSLPWRQRRLWVRQEEDKEQWVVTAASQQESRSGRSGWSDHTLQGVPVGRTPMRSLLPGLVSHR